MKRYLLSIAFLLVTVGCAWAQVPYDERFDTNRDGEVSLEDVTVLVDYLLGKINTHESVDLGLLSGTLWATCNIGATNPEDYGDYFAWGEYVPMGKEDKSNTTNYDAQGTYEKRYFVWDTYKWCVFTNSTLTKSVTKTTLYHTP